MYTLRFPFRLPPGQEITPTDKSIITGNLEFSLKREDRFYILTIGGFPSEDDAKKYIDSIWAGLLLHLGLSPHAEFQTQKVAYTEDPHQAARRLLERFGLQRSTVDGVIDGGMPAVYPTDKHLLTTTMGLATVGVTTPAMKVLEILSEGASYSRSSELIADDKLRLALELYGAYYWESNSNTRFLTLVMALEALAPRETRPAPVIRLIKKWQSELEEQIEKTDSTQKKDLESLESLRGGVERLKEESIKSSIRNFVQTTLQLHGIEADQTAKKVGEIYDLRSILLHEGKLEPSKLGRATTDAADIVKRVLLRACFIQDT
jgi:hypothetical protein